MKNLMSILVAAVMLSGLQAAEKKHVLMLAGANSHAPGEHEHKAGVLLLAKTLEQQKEAVEVKVLLDSTWPGEKDLAWADTILFYADGGAGHFMLKESRLEQLKKVMDRGCGIVNIHYSVEYPKEKGGPEMLNWMGGYFEMNWSVNPHWKASFNKFPQHPVTQGVAPFSTQDEWYFHMRFRGDDKGKLTHILSAVPPVDTIKRPDGPHSGNPTVREEVKAGKEQTVAWAFERPDGGRGFGFTGGHFHAGWANDNQRKLVHNAIFWTAKANVPTNGVDSKVSEEDMEANVRQKKGKLLFNGKNLDGWEGDTEKTWKVEDGSIVAGSTEKQTPRNEFLCTTKEYQNFELRLKYKLEGTEGFINSGVQIRSKRIPNHHEVIGYQADIGKGFDGAIYDESRRNKVLAAPTAEKLKLNSQDWNDYRIRAEGKRIRLWINGVQTVDYTEPDASIANKGIIGVQIHGGGKAKVSFKEIEIVELPS